MEEYIYFLLRWFHFLAGITWIGILYYFNFIQTPFFGTDLGGEATGALTRGLVPTALGWFRWGAMFTFVTGLPKPGIVWTAASVSWPPRAGSTITSVPIRDSP